MKKLLILTAYVFLLVSVFATNVYATTYKSNSFQTGSNNEYGTITDIDSNTFNLKGKLNEEAGMVYGPYSKISTGKLNDGITEEVNVGIDLDKLDSGEFFEVTVSLDNDKKDYLTEAVAMVQKVGDEVVVTTGNWFSGFRATIKKSGVYTFQWKYSKEDNQINARFTILDYGKEVNTTGNVKLKDLTGVTDVSDVTVRSLWFCNIQAKNGVDVYTTLPKIDEPTQQPAEKPDQKDDTPKTGTVDMALVASVVGMISLAGIVALKNHNK